MIKTKLAHALAKPIEGKSGYDITPIDQVINQFLIENEIDENKLIDIKFSTIGYFQPNNEGGELESSALIIYKD